RWSSRARRRPAPGRGGRGRSVIVLRPAGSAGRADIQLRGTDGTWQTVGALAGPYTEVSTAGRTADAVRLVWSAGSAAPEIAEVVVCQD
ncbi:hypothetical protein ACFU9X_05995, partial [Streptomyces atratus]|uniref:hypothetical protein n=1 Tax=Streptomyces atratus TaxID=1893 RepID=UPI0036890B40